MNKPPRIPPPPKGCYKSCQYDQQIMDIIGKNCVRAAVAFGIAFGLVFGVMSLVVVSDIIKSAQ